MSGRLKMFIAAGATAVVAAAVGSGVAVAGDGGDDSTEVALNKDVGSGASAAGSGDHSTEVALNKDAGSGASAAGSGDDDAGGGDDDSTEVAIKGDGLSRASAKALDYTGEGTVTGTEEGDEESYYEVEVTLDDGSQVDVQLNKSFEIVGSENDGVEDGN